MDTNDKNPPKKTILEKMSDSLHDLRVVISMKLYLCFVGFVAYVFSTKED